jgi:hypothetical protein
MDKFLLVEQKGASGLHYGYSDGLNNGNGCDSVCGSSYSGNGRGAGYGSENGDGYGNGRFFSPMTISGTHFGIGGGTVSANTRRR